jgi:hypothetical protein
VSLVDFVDRVGQLTATPVFSTVNGTAGTGDHALVFFDHGWHLFALVRMDQKHDFVVSHCVPFWLKSGRLARNWQDTDLDYSHPAIRCGKS